MNRLRLWPRSHGARNTPSLIPAPPVNQQNVGYTDLPSTFRLGFIVSLVSLVVYGVVGAVWWKVVGLY